MDRETIGEGFMEVSHEKVSLDISQKRRAKAAFFG